MKESVTKFDIEAAFKALDEIEVPKVRGGIKANKPALSEMFTKKTKFDALFEEYYNISNSDGFSAAKEARDAEIAQAKLARIEKIVDLDAESPEDILTSYVGKYIIQCPQCMTLFYKNQEDVVESEDDSSVVNVEEVCQHCGNDSGYTLIGKVGEADTDDDSEIPEESQDETETTELTTEETTEESSNEAAEQEVTEESEDTDLGDLEELDLEIEDDEEKKEESFTNDLEGNYLLEQLTEDTDLEISANEFEELINSSEFKKPISPSEAEEMLRSEDDLQEGIIDDSLREGVPPVLTIKETSGTFAKEICKKVASQVGGKVTRATANGCSWSADDEKQFARGEALMHKLIKHSQIPNAPVVTEAINTTSGSLATELEEGIFDKLFSALKSRESKADWILKNALVDYENLELEDDGSSVKANDANKRFKTFLVVCFKGTYSSGKEITQVPNDKTIGLVPGLAKPEAKANYAAADTFAKGWSMKQGNGPAFIYLAKDANDTKAVRLCTYFKGTLVKEQDNLEKYFEAVKNDLKGSKLMTKAGGAASNAETTKVKAADLKVGMQVKVGKDEKGEITAIGNSKLDSQSINVTIKFSDGSTENHCLPGNTQLSIFTDSIKTEAYSIKNELSAIMESLDTLQDVSLESCISTVLTENYENVAGFKLTDCTYANDTLSVTGNLYFTSGNLCKTTYSFTEAYKKNNKTILLGENKKLANSNKFKLTGYCDKTKTFITESFKLN